MQRGLVKVGASAVVLLCAWLLGQGPPGRIPVPRPVQDGLPRTVQVLDAEESAYLASLYSTHSGTWPQTYFNLLVHRWSAQDERLGSIFEKVVNVANSLSGGAGDYTIVNDFFSFRAPGVAQFAPNGVFHMDCDFWKIDSSDGFNLWVLIDHDGLNDTFDLVERSNNLGLYDHYHGEVPLYLLPLNTSIPSSPYMPFVRPQKRYLSGHQDALNWRVAFQILVQLGREAWRELRPEWFIVPGLNVSHVSLGVGQALVLREQELHRSDLHRPLSDGQRRLAVGFKMQRRQSVLTTFDLFCTSQKDRMNLPPLWERIGDVLPDIYAKKWTRTELRHLAFSGRLLCLLSANAYSLVAISALAVAASAAGWTGPRRAALVALVVSVVLMAAAAIVQWRWLFAMARPSATEGARLRSAILD